jgi:hypothetical protein
MQSKTLIAFFKGTAGEYRKLRDLAPGIISMAAQMRNSISPYKTTDFRR